MASDDGLQRSSSGVGGTSSAINLRLLVHTAYEAFLGRPPENDAVVAYWLALGSAEEILLSIAGAEEARPQLDAAGKARSQFDHYAAMFDAEETIRRHARRDLTPDPRWLTNFLGVRIEERYLPTMLSGKAGFVEDLPIPANWHADVAEWAGALRAVDLAQGTFVIAELGCGWGCWLNNAGVAARNRGLKPTLIGVEGDKGHIDFARECCKLNNFRAEEITLHHGIAAARGGTALFPRQQSAGHEWGLEPIIGASDEQMAEAAEGGRFDILRMVPLEEIVGDQPFLDLLHIDIQGGEADLIEQNVGMLAQRVAYMLVGTHSRIIEGRIEAALAGSPWRLEIERPAIVSLGADGPVTVVDGVQGWRNMALRPE